MLLVLNAHHDLVRIHVAVAQPGGAAWRLLIDTNVPDRSEGDVRVRFDATALRDVHCCCSRS